MNALRLGKEMGKQSFHVPIGWEKLAEDRPADVNKQLLEVTQYCTFIVLDSLFDALSTSDPVVL